MNCVVKTWLAVDRSVTGTTNNTVSGRTHTVTVNIEKIWQKLDYKMYICVCARVDRKYCTILPDSYIFTCCSLLTPVYCCYCCRWWWLSSASERGVKRHLLYLPAEKMKREEVELQWTEPASHGIIDYNSTTVKGAALSPTCITPESCILCNGSYCTVVCT